MHESDPNRHDTGELSFGAVAMDRVGLRGWEGGREGKWGRSTARL